MKIILQFVALCVMVPIAFCMTTCGHLIAWVVDIIFIPEELLDLIKERQEENKNEL